MSGKLVSSLLLSAAFILPATAQTQPQQIQPQQIQPSAQVAQQCLQELQEFQAQAQRDGYWIAGWGTRWGEGPTTVPPATIGPPRTTPGVVGEPAVREGVPQPGPFGTVGPWGPTGIPAVGIMSPRHQMRMIYSAAVVFAHRGNDAACRALVGELQNIYAETIAALEEAGVRPDQIVTWRQEQIVAAQDVTEIPWTISTDQIIGTEIRNAQDQHLGTVDDLVFDHQTGELTYAIVSHGGVLGIGADHVAIPWEILQVAPNLNLFVLNVPETVVANAPQVDPDRFASPPVYDAYRQQVDQYWQQHAPA